MNPLTRYYRIVNNIRNCAVNINGIETVNGIEIVNGIETVHGIESVNRNENKTIICGGDYAYR